MTDFNPFKGTASYLTDPALEAAVNASLVLQRPFDPVPALASLVAHAVPGVETIDGGVVRRVVLLVRMIGLLEVLRRSEVARACRLAGPALGLVRSHRARAH